MKTKLNICVVLYRECNQWIAHCLEFDLLGNGATHEKALCDLMEAIVLQAEHNICLFFAAPGEFFQKFARGANVMDNLKPCIKQLSESYPVIIEGIAVREYIRVDYTYRRTLAPGP